MSRLMMEPNKDSLGFLIYAIITPGICFFGIAGNFVCLIVLLKMKTNCSFYVYLAGIGIVDLLTCITIFMSGLARSVLRQNEKWVASDSLIFVPLAEFLNSIGAYSTIFVTIDRLIYLRNPIRTTKPKFCEQRIATKIMLFICLCSAVYNIPYAFIYKVTDDGSLDTTAFYYSVIFLIYNWMDITFFAIIPIIVLSIGNTMLFLSVRRTCEISKQCRKNLFTGKVKQLLDQTKITITLMAIVFFYLIGEVPTHFTKKTNAANILFGGDHIKAQESATLEYMRYTTTILNAIHLAVKFILYAFFCPPFYKSLKKAMCHYSSKERQIATKIFTINLFFIEDHVFNSLERCAKFDFTKLKNWEKRFIMYNTHELPRLI